LSQKNKECKSGNSLEQEIEQLRAENARLKKSNAAANAYIRQKVDQMLKVIGTKTLNPDELDDASLVEFDPIGTVTGSFQYILDNLRATNKKLQFAHDEIQAVFDSVGAALMVLNPQQEIVAFNRKTEELFLGMNTDVLGASCKNIVCKGHQPESCLFPKVVNTGREQTNQDWSFEGRDFNVVGRPIFDNSGEISHVVMAYSDVTARKAAETALRQSLDETQEANSKIEGILNSVPDNLLVTDADDRIILMNRRAEVLLGICLHDKAHDCNIDLLPEPKLVQLLKNARNGESSLREDLSFYDDNDNEFIYQARATIIRSSDGDFRGCITFLHDVTEQREVERMKSEFVSTAAHELRTPLTTIIGYTDLLLNDVAWGKEQMTEYLQQIQIKAEHLANIVTDLLDISRIESGESLKLNQSSYPLKELCDEALAGYTAISGQHAFELDLPEDEPVWVEVDHFAFIQVLENILSNAAKYSPEGGNIRVSARAENGECCISISDEGIGMSPDQLEQVFEKFYRANTANTAISGTGLGMTIVKHLVEALNGTVAVESEPDQGTTVHVTFPLAEVIIPGESENISVEEKGVGNI